MVQGLAREALPWVATAAVVAVMADAWVALYIVNAGAIAAGTASQVNRNVVLDKSVVDYSGLVAALIVAAGVLYRTRNKSIPLLVQEIRGSLRPPASAAGGKSDPPGEGQGGWGRLFSVVFKDILLLGRMGECEDFQQWFGHFLILWGFIGLAVTTTLDAIVNGAAVPLPITHPVRLLGNFTGVMLIAGLTLSMTRRLTHSEVRTNSKAGDWVFLTSLYGTALTGFFVQAFADTSNVAGTWAAYPVHLAFIAFLLVSAPWTKFVHALWRPSWVVYTKLSAQGER
jgi:nitrate reductase gamma subunit